MSAARVASDASSRFMFFSVGVLGVVVLAAGLWTGAQYGGNYKEVGADGKGGYTEALSFHRRGSPQSPLTEAGTGSSLINRACLRTSCEARCSPSLDLHPRSTITKMD